MGKLEKPHSGIDPEQPSVRLDKQPIIIHRVNRANHEIQFFEHHENDNVQVPAVQADIKPRLASFGPVGKEKNEGCKPCVDEEKLRPGRHPRGKGDVKNGKKGKKEDADQVCGRKRSKQVTESHASEPL